MEKIYMLIIDDIIHDYTLKKMYTYSHCIFIIRIVYFLGIPSKIILIKNNLNPKPCDHSIDDYNFST